MRALVIVGLVLLSPTAFGLAINPESPTYEGEQEFGNKISETYTFNLPNPPFNYTPAEGANDSIEAWRVVASWPYGEDTYITQNTVFRMGWAWNTSEAFKANFIYTKHGWGSFAYWNVFFEGYYNGEQICTADVASNVAVNAIAGLYGSSIRPRPQGVLKLEVGTINQSGTNESDRISWTFIDPNTKTIIYCFNDATNAQYINATRLSAPLTLEMSQSDSAPRRQLVAWRFQNGTMYDSWLANVTAQNEGDDCRTGFLVRSVCLLSTIVTGLIGFIFGFILQGLALVFDFFPGGAELFKVLRWPVDAVLELTFTVADVYLAPGPGYGPGGTYLMLWVYSACLGCVATIYTGEMRFMWAAPLGFLKVTTIGVFYAFRYIYWEIPKAAITFLISIVSAIRG